MQLMLCVSAVVNIAIRLLLFVVRRWKPKHTVEDAPALKLPVPFPLPAWVMNEDSPEQFTVPSQTIKPILESPERSLDSEIGSQDRKSISWLDGMDSFNFGVVGRDQPEKIIITFPPLVELSDESSDDEWQSTDSSESDEELDEPFPSPTWESNPSIPIQIVESVQVNRPKGILKSPNQSIDSIGRKKKNVSWSLDRHENNSPCKSRIISLIF